MDKFCPIFILDDIAKAAGTSFDEMTLKVGPPTNNDVTAFLFYPYAVIIDHLWKDTKVTYFFRNTFFLNSCMAQTCFYLC